MVSFESDYNNGVAPEILRAFEASNDDTTSGYGHDKYTESAKAKIRRAIGMPEADICFLVGGTQSNATVIDSLLRGGEGVVCAETGHINVNEAGAVEAFGHKVISLPTKDSKLTAAGVDKYLTDFYANESYEHMVPPVMVYITLPTELGLLYSADELRDLYAVCRKHGLYLYIDGARLGYGLMAEGSNLSLSDVAHSCDVFYIGGTKVGAMFGEAIVYTGVRAPRHLFSIVKNHGALLAKGRMLGIQFDTLFTDDFYFRLARHAVEMAGKMRDCFRRHGIKSGVDSPTNLQFVILTPAQVAALQKRVVFEVWQPLENGKVLCRFVTSWATKDTDIDELDKALTAIE